MRVRQSYLNVFASCQMKAYFRYVEELPDVRNSKTSFGTIIHKVLEDYTWHHNLSRAIDDWKNYWDNPEILDAKPEVWAKFTTFGGLREKGIEILTEYHAKQKWESREVIATEHRFLVPMGEHELEGTVDLIEVKKNSKGKEQLKIVDWKSSARIPTLLQLRVNLQHTLYIYSSLQKEFWYGNGEGFPPIPEGDKLFERFKDVERRAVWSAVWQNKELDAGPRDDGDFMRLYRLIQMVERANKEKVFVPNISGETCPICPFTQQCGLPIPPAEGAWEDV